MKHLLFVILIPLVTFGIVGCKGQTNPISEVDFVQTLPEPTTDNVVVDNSPIIAKSAWGWSYSGSEGPGGWAKLRPEFGLCGTGKSQSPLNLVYRTPTGGKSFSLNYQKGKASLVNAGYALRVNFTPQSQINFDGKEYILEKAEIRTPSEHTLSTKTLPAEIQLYHRSPSGLRRGIVSLFVVQGKASPAFEPLLVLASELKDSAKTRGIDFDPMVLIPPRKTFYQYSGSLTHPPCHEGVEWFVFNTPIQMSSGQLDVLRSVFKDNNRPVQSLNGRKILNYK